VDAKRSEASASSPTLWVGRESIEGNGGGGGRLGHATRQREKERKGAAQGRQPDRMVGMALGGVVRGGSARSQWRRAGEQGRAAGRRRRSAAWRG
jgi:hypothetical protein